MGYSHLKVKWGTTQDLTVSLYVKRTLIIRSYLHPNAYHASDLQRTSDRLNFVSAGSWMSSFRPSSNNGPHPVSCPPHSLNLTSILISNYGVKWLEDPFPNKPVSEYRWASSWCRQGTEDRSSETYNGRQWQHPRSVSDAYSSSNPTRWRLTCCFSKGDSSVCQHAWCASRWIPFWRCCPWWRELWINTMYERENTIVFVCYIKHVLLFPLVHFTRVLYLQLVATTPCFDFAFYIYILALRVCVCVIQDGAR